MVCWSTPWWASADSALPCPVSKYITLLPIVPRLQRQRRIARLAQQRELDAEARFAASVPAIDWNTRSTGAPRSIARMLVVTCASTQLWVGMA